MKILHTADWHLGQKFHWEERTEEHQIVLNWLYDFIVEQTIDVLIVAGDVFDVSNPSNAARRMYYDFLKKLINTTCRHIVIVAGNHDAPSTIEAPKELLKILNIHVVGSIKENIQEELIELVDAKGQIEAVVAAVPYLREQDLRISIAGQNREDQRGILKKGIINHYEALAEEIENKHYTDIPILATGHLFAEGGNRDGRTDYIHLSDLKIHADDFPKLFHYIALGHLHRPQKVNNYAHIRYSGSLIPLDFNEINYDQSVTVIEFDKNRLVYAKEYQIPVPRKIRHYRGNIDYIKEKLGQVPSAEALRTWLKLEVEVDTRQYYLQEELEKLIQNKNIEIIDLTQATISLREKQEKPIIQDLREQNSEQKIFEMLCQQKGFSEEVLLSLKDTYNELLRSMKDSIE